MPGQHSRDVFVDVSCILLVTCRCDTAGSRASFVSSQKPLAVDTNIIGHSWNTHHLTCQAVTITSTTWCKHEVLKCTETQPSAWIPVHLDSPTDEYVCFSGAVCGFEAAIYVHFRTGGHRWGHLSSLAAIRYSTWFDMMIQAQLRDGLVWKMWWWGE